MKIVYKKRRIEIRNTSALTVSSQRENLGQQMSPLAPLTEGFRGRDFLLHTKHAQGTPSDTFITSSTRTVNHETCTKLSQHVILSCITHENDCMLDVTANDEKNAITHRRPRTEQYKLSRKTFSLIKNILNNNLFLEWSFIKFYENICI